MPRLSIHVRFVRGIHATINMNDNNNRTSPQQMQDRYFRMLLYQFAIAYTKFVSPVKRKAIEYAIFSFALLSLFVLVYMHICFIRNPINCFGHDQDDWPRDGVLRVEIVRNLQNKDYTLEKSYAKERQIRAMKNHVTSIFYVDIFDENDSSDDLTREKSDGVDYDKDKILNDNDESVINFKLDQDEKVPDSSDKYAIFGEIFNSTKKDNNYPSAESSENSEHQNLRKIFLPHKKKFQPVYPGDEYIVEYALEYGLLRLSPSTRKRLNIPVKLVALDPAKDECFGGWLSRLLLEHIFGYDQFLMASLRSLAEKENNRGYVHNVVTGDNFRFITLLVSHASLVTAAIVMLVFTLSISMLLKYSHLQIFAFIVQIFRVLDFRSPAVIPPTGSLLIVILALVGMEAIISEFFNDTSTAFYIIIIVWIADLYDSFCCRTTISKRHWLRFFYLYHFAFYAYDFRFSGQYSKLALFTSCCFIFHSMVYFFHHYELPAILRAARNFEAAYHDLMREIRQIPTYADVPETVPNHLLPEAEQVIPDASTTEEVSQEVPEEVVEINETPSNVETDSNVTESATESSSASTNAVDGFASLDRHRVSDANVGLFRSPPETVNVEELCLNSQEISDACNETFHEIDIASQVRNSQSTVSDQDSSPSAIDKSYLLDIHGKEKRDETQLRVNTAEHQTLLNNENNNFGIVISSSDSAVTSHPSASNAIASEASFVSDCYQRINKNIQSDKNSSLLDPTTGAASHSEQPNANCSELLTESSEGCAILFRSQNEDCSSSETTNLSSVSNINLEVSSEAKESIELTDTSATSVQTQLEQTWSK